MVELHFSQLDIKEVLDTEPFQRMEEAFPSSCFWSIGLMTKSLAANLPQKETEQR